MINTIKNVSWLNRLIFPASCTPLSGQNHKQIKTLKDSKILYSSELDRKNNVCSYKYQYPINYLLLKSDTKSIDSHPTNDVRMNENNTNKIINNITNIKPNTTIVFFHGNNVNLINTFPLLYSLYSKLNQNVNILCVEYPGYLGDMSQWATEETMSTLYPKYLEHILNLNNIKPKDCIYVGHSLGGCISILCAVLHKPRQVICISTFVSIRQLVHEWYGWINNLMSERFETCKFVRQLSCPLILIHGDNDQVIPYRHSIKLYNYAKFFGIDVRCIVCVDSDHNDLPIDDLVVKFGNGLS